MTFTFHGQNADEPLPEDTVEVTDPGEMDSLTAGVDNRRPGENPQPSGLSAAH